MARKNAKAKRSGRKVQVSRKHQERSAVKGRGWMKVKP